MAYLPASNLLGATGPVIGERTLYTTSVGVAMLVAWCLERVFAYAAEHRERLAARASAIVGALAVLVACGRAYRHTTAYAEVWRDQPSLFAQVIRADSLHYRGYQLLAIEAENHDRFDEARRWYARAYTMRPYDPTLLTGYGEFLMRAHRPRHALAIAQRLVRDPSVGADPRAARLYLDAVRAVWGADSAAATMTRFRTRAPVADVGAR
jgi:cytochrome c-type biogenesis protein CcmH/NrfG